VAKDATHIAVGLIGYKAGLVPAKVACTDERLGVTLLKIKVEGFNLSPAELRDSATVTTGEVLLLLGFPQRPTLLPVAGRVERTDNADTMQMTTKANKGYIGGGVFDTDGKLVGIVVAVENQPAGNGKQADHADPQGGAEGKANDKPTDRPKLVQSTVKIIGTAALRELLVKNDLKPAMSNDKPTAQPTREKLQQVMRNCARSVCYVLPSRPPKQ